MGAREKLMVKIRLIYERVLWAARVPTLILHFKVMTHSDERGGGGARTSYVKSQTSASNFNVQWRVQYVTDNDNPFLPNLSSTQV